MDAARIRKSALLRNRLIYTRNGTHGYFHGEVFKLAGRVVTGKRNRVIAASEICAHRKCVTFNRGNVTAGIDCICKSTRGRSAVRKTYIICKVKGNCFGVVRPNAEQRVVALGRLYLDELYTLAARD